VLLVCLDAPQLGHLGDQQGEVEGNRFELELAGGDLGEVEDVVDDTESQRRYLGEQGSGAAAAG
jgi:hypothetical protein